MKGGKVRKELVYPRLSYEIIGILFEVYNELGYGHKEKYYQKAIEVALMKTKKEFRSQCPYQIRYHGEIIGRYFVDFIIEGKIVLEIKQGDHYSRNNFNQVLSYLQVTNMKLGILANFTPNGLKYKRIVNIL